MDENRILRNNMDRIRQDMQAENLEALERGVPIAREIIDRNLQLDNSREGAELLLEGVRVSIFQKGDLYYLGYTSNSSKLFHPSKDIDFLMSLYYDLNSERE